MKTSILKEMQIFGFINCYNITTFFKVILKITLHKFINLNIQFIFLYLISSVRTITKKKIVSKREIALTF